MITRTQAIKNFLTAKTHSDLAEAYYKGMEVQVNVAKDNGDRVSTESFRGRTSHSYTDGAQQWYSFRIPKKAFSDPEDNDDIIKYDLAEHAEGIGMTGWDWQRRVSKWVGFDFDAISGHSSGLTDIELNAVKKHACDIPWVTVRKSTSGAGIHLYVFLNDIPTKNHTEHAALGRSILGKLSAVADFDFESKVDVAGGNMWVWHRKMTPENGGLKLIKQGASLEAIPENWRDHVVVIKGNRRKTLPRYVENASEFDSVNNGRNRIKLDNEHKKLFQYLDEVQAQWWWDADRQMIVCHTFDLKTIHKRHQLLGKFDTKAEGTRQGADHNCFVTPLTQPPGAWVVRRYAKGIEETPNWDQDANGYTTCYFNRPVTLQAAVRMHGGAEDDKGVYHFKHASDADLVASDLGVSFKIPEWAKDRPTKLAAHKDGRLVVTIDRLDSDESMLGWVEEKGHWKRLFNATLKQPGESTNLDFDRVVRHIVTTKGEDFGWAVSCSGTWRLEPLTHVRLALKSFGLSTSDITDMLGGAVVDAWTLVNEPFQEEFPGGRRWNRNAAQFAYEPKREGPFTFPTWQKILTHCGLGLDSAVATNSWCHEYGILNGADYLKIWAASLFQFPKRRLPYLFFYSKTEKTGKTTFSESLGSLLTKGYVRIDHSLISSAGFNGEMEHAILCAVEETNLGKNQFARNRIKDWITAKNLTIHHKGMTPYEVQNCTHIVQTGNDHTECPIFAGDTRITMIQVPSFDAGEMIPPEQLNAQLAKEAPDFLGELLSVEIPPSGDRLNVPIIDTEIKNVASEENKNSVEIFFDEEMHDAPGELVLFGELFDRFREWVDPNELHDWTKRSFGRAIPEKYPKGRSPRLASKVCVGNISLTEPTEKNGEPYFLHEGKLLKESK